MVLADIFEAQLKYLAAAMDAQLLTSFIEAASRPLRVARRSLAVLNTWQTFAPTESECVALRRLTQRLVWTNGFSGVRHPFAQLVQKARTRFRRQDDDAPAVG